MKPEHSMERQGRDGLCFLWVVSRTMARTGGGAAGAKSTPCTSSPLGAVGTLQPPADSEAVPEQIVLSPGALVLTCTFLFRLTAGKNRPSTFSKAMGPCCSLLMKNVNVFLFKSRRTPMVAPFVIPPSVLWEKGGNGVLSACCRS